MERVDAGEAKRHDALMEDLVSSRAYQLLSGQCRVEVFATSLIHDVQMATEELHGTLTVPQEESILGMRGQVQVPMRGFSTGDRLQDWRLGSVLDAETHPLATFSFTGLERVEASAEGGSRIHGRGTIFYRDDTLELAFSGSVDFRDALAFGEIECRLDMTSLGVRPPSFLGIAVSPDVRVVVSLEAESAQLS